MNYSKRVFNNQTFKQGELDNNNYSKCTFDGCEFPKAVALSNFSKSKFIKCKFKDTTFVDCNLSYVGIPDDVKTTRCNKNMVEPTPEPDPVIIVSEVIPDEKGEISCPNCMSKMKVKK